MKRLRQWYNYLLSPQRQLARQVAKLTGLLPANLSLYQMAFTHSSATGDLGYNNERLELVGDAVFDVLVSAYLYQKYPDKSEGFLTEMRAKIVSRKAINNLAQTMDMQEYIASTLSAKHLRNSSTLGNAFEALIGAIYFDLGHAAAKQFVEKQVLARHYDLSKLESLTVNYKSKLIQYGQKHAIAIRYEMLSEEKTKDGKQYTMGVYFDDILMAKAIAFNKKQAEQAASKTVVDQLDLTTDA